MRWLVRVRETSIVEYEVKADSVNHVREMFDHVEFDGEYVDEYNMDRDIIEIQLMERQE